jgi:hypothetical protein
MDYPIEITRNLHIVELCEIHSDSGRRPVSADFTFYGQHCRATLTESGAGYAESDSELHESFTELLDDHEEKLNTIRAKFLQEQDGEE